MEFYPSFSAFTFPFVISALATKGIATTVKTSFILDNVANIEIVIATILVVYVLAKYVVFLKNS